MRISPLPVPPSRGRSSSSRARHAGWLLAVLLLAGPLSPVHGDGPPAPASGPVSVGAIRWDAWYGHRAGPGAEVARTLAPAHFRHRLPFFASIDERGNVHLPGYSRQVMGAEIEGAAAAGLRFWAFVLYPEGSDMDRGLQAYLAHPQAGRIGFCLISTTGHWNPATAPALAARLGALMARPNHHRTPEGRPVLMLLAAPAPDGLTPGLRRLGGIAAVTRLIRAAAATRKLPEPYFVVLGPNPRTGAALARSAGGAAVGFYASQPPAGRGPYTALARHAESEWNRLRQTGLEVLPTAMTGWDRRPRMERPVSWERGQRLGNDRSRFFQAGTPEQIAEHVAKGVRWVERHPAAVPSRSLLVYAWNEHDEGGALCPDLGRWDACLQALAPVLAPGPQTRPGRGR